MNRSLTSVPCWRVIGTRVPAADLFGGIADYGEWEAVFEIENLWNERSLGVLGNLDLVPREHRAYGPGSAYIMAPFAYLAQGRFGDGSYGVLYAGLDERTAIVEVAWHRERFMKESGNPKETMDLQLLGLVFDGTVEDLRGVKHPAVYAPDSWLSGQALATQIRGQGLDGIAYDSVRRLGGECLAGFRPNAFSQCRHVRPLQFFWDGIAIHHG